MTNTTYLNIEELKGFLTHIIDNNRYLQERGKPAVAVEVQGESGIGKTQSIIQLAKSMNFNFVKLNLAQIEEVGDLVGFPIRQFEMKPMTSEWSDKSTDCQWVDEIHVEEFRKNGFISTGRNRMDHCPPKWIADKTEGGILLLDDWSRGDTRLLQAVMELIDRQEYAGWRLPKDWHIVLTSNPDNGNYLVHSIDDAQRTRFISVNVSFDLKCWSAWAESEGIDGRCINFLLLHPELASGKVNSRMITMFFNSISSLENFEKSLPMIQMIGDGSVGNEFTALFTSFINNKLDRLITPENIISQDEQYVLNTLKSLIGSQDNYRADIAATLGLRIINYLKHTKAPITKDIVSRIGSVVKSNVFGPDVSYNVIKNVYASRTKEFSALLNDNELVKYILG